jgi:hypothetical protein
MLVAVCAVRSWERWCTVDQQQRIGAMQHHSILGDQRRWLVLERRRGAVGSLQEVDAAGSCVAAAPCAPVRTPYLEGRVMRTGPGTSRALQQRRHLMSRRWALEARV